MRLSRGTGTAYEQGIRLASWEAFWIPVMTIEEHFDPDRAIYRRKTTEAA